MGVDSSIFDEVSKDCFYFDRRTNFLLWPDVDERATEIRDRIYTIASGRATSEEIVYLCDQNIKYFTEEPDLDERDRGRAYWSECIKKFALARPNGSFFTASDHDNYLSWDIKDNQGYRDVRYDKDGNEEEGHS